VGYKREAFVDPDGAATAFALDLADKDLDLITGFADTLGVPHPQSTVNRALVRAAAADGQGARDFSTVAVHLRQQVSRPATAPEQRGGPNQP
jgi:3-hydroxyisobutyrate dehydrogenase/2-hydroxy-3-oxopropionate reductase